MSDYLSEEEQVARFRAWWSENGLMTLGAIVLAVAAVSGWQWYGSYSQAQTEAASTLYESYREASDSEKSALALQMADEFGGSTYHVFVLLDQAGTAIEADQFDQAEEFLELAVGTSADALITDAARIRLAKVQQQLDRSEAALATLAGIKSEGYRSQALEVKGDIHMLRDEVEQAHAAYSAAVDSLEAGDERPILTIKRDNAAPLNGEFVVSSNPLAEALEDAAQTLSSADTDMIDADSASDASEAVVDAVESEAVESEADAGEESDSVE